MMRSSCPVSAPLLLLLCWSLSLSWVWQVHSFVVSPSLGGVVGRTWSSHRPSSSSRCRSTTSTDGDYDATNDWIVEKQDDDESVADFSSLGLCWEALEAIEAQDGWYVPTPIQQLAIPRLVHTQRNGTAVWCQAPTGSGKTAAFVVPLLQRLLLDHQQQQQQQHPPTSSAAKTNPKIRSLILCPTRELATQIGQVVTQLASHMMPRKKKCRILVITGGYRREDQIAQLADWTSTGKTVDVVIATPGRLVDVLTHYTTSTDSSNKNADDDETQPQTQAQSKLTAAEAALERRLLQALEDTDKSSLSLDTIQKLKLDRDDDQGRQALSNLLQGLEYLILDEADRLLGRAFETEVNAVLELLQPKHQRNHNSQHQQQHHHQQQQSTVVESWLFSATFPKMIEPRVDAVLKQLGQTSTLRISCANSDRILDEEEISATLQKKLERAQQNINQESLEQIGPASTIQLRTIRLEQRDRTQALKYLWQENQHKWGGGDSSQGDAAAAAAGVLVFVSTRYAAEHVSRKLRRAGIRSSELHGKLDQEARTRRLRDLETGKIHVLCTTDLASRGLDVVGLSAVVNYDLPRSTTDFVHRVGRTGRAGRPGEAITFVTPTTEAHYDLIEQRHIPEPTQREMLPGFELDEEKWNIQAEGARIRTPGAGPSDNDLAHDKMFGGIKGKRKSKKDRLREKAAQEAAAAAVAKNQ